jgi:hypothetical protein
MQNEDIEEYDIICRRQANCLGENHASHRCKAPFNDHTERSANGPIISERESSTGSKRVNVHASSH